MSDKEDKSPSTSSAHQEQQSPLPSSSQQNNNHQKNKKHRRNGGKKRSGDHVSDTAAEQRLMERKSSLTLPPQIPLQFQGYGQPTPEKHRKRSKRSKQRSRAPRSPSISPSSSSMLAADHDEALQQEQDPFAVSGAQRAPRLADDSALPETDEGDDHVLLRHDQRSASVTMVSPTEPEQSDQIQTNLMGEEEEEEAPVGQIGGYRPMAFSAYRSTRGFLDVPTSTRASTASEEEEEEAEEGGKQRKQLLQKEKTPLRPLLPKNTLRSMRMKPGNNLEDFDSLKQYRMPLSASDESSSTQQPNLEEDDYSEAEPSMSREDEVIRERVSKNQRIPHKGTNINDIRMKTDFHQYGKRFIIVGLNYECHTFKTLRSLVDHISQNNVAAQPEPPTPASPSATVIGKRAANAPQVLRFEDPVWIDVQNPSVSDMKMIEKYFGLHPLTTEDIINLDTGEKWELFADYMFVVFTGQVDDELPAPPSFAKLLPAQMHHHATNNETQLNIVLFRDYVITIHDRPIKGLDLLMKRIETEFEFDIEKGKMESNCPTYKYDVQRSLTKKLSSAAMRVSDMPAETTLAVPSSKPTSESPTTKGVVPPPPIEPPVECKRTHVPSSDWILYAFLDAMVDMYIPFVDSLVLEVDNLDELVFMLAQCEQNDLLKRLGLAKRNVISLRRLLLPKQRMTTYLASQPIRFLSNNVQVYLRDVLDHLQICLEKLEVARENLNQTHNNYLTKVQIEIAEASGRTDEFMNRITVIASLLGPLTLISSVWGMNVKVPGQDVDNYWWFVGICVGMVVIALILIIMLRNKLISK